MADNYSPHVERVTALTREMLPLCGDYEPGEIERAAAGVIRREEFFPKVSTYLKYCDAERARRRTGEVVSPGFGGWRTDLDILRAWVMGYQLDVEYWRRVVPLRMKANGEGRPPLSEYDTALTAWLPKADPAAVAGLLDDLLQASGPWAKAEPEHIARLRRALHYDAKEMAGGLRPTERVDLIKARAAEIQSDRRRAGT